MLFLSSNKIKNQYGRIMLVLILTLIFTHLLKGQKFLPDTLIVDFKGDSLIDMDLVSVVKINDFRNENPHFVRFETKKKYLFIPIDYEIYTRKPLSDEILSSMSGDTGRRYNYILDIRKFEIEKKKRRFASSVYLVADIPVYEHTGDTCQYRGTLYYDYLYLPQAKKESLEESTENLLSSWHTDFKIDLLTIKSISSDIAPEIAPNFITNPKIRSLYLNSMGGVFMGINWWGMQGEIYFTRPETNLKNQYTSGIIRYQNNPDYESFAIGKNSEHYSWRWNRKLLLDADLNILLGFCKWKDIEKHDPTLYQLFDIEASSVQSIYFNPMNKRGLTARIGLIENISYIIDKKIKIQAGLFVGLGFKL